MQEESRKDSEISKITKLLRQGSWPAKPEENMRDWKALRHALSTQDGCLYFGHRLISEVLSKNAVHVNSWTAFTSRIVSRTSDKTTLTLLKETTEGEKGPRNAKMEKQFNRHHGARKRSYKIGEPVWIRDYRPGHKRWILAHVKSRLDEFCTTF
ncbi:30S ribosomal protein S17 domain protein [Ostertagia ostertagi]